MKTIGLLGGMSWESTVGYYRQINEGVKRELGGLHSAKIAMYSVDFEPVERLQHAGDWEGAAQMLALGAQKVAAAGADFLLICTNTMHRVADEVEAAAQIPLLHIADATAEVLKKEGISTVGLLGTAFTMEQDFYKGRLRDRYGLKVLIPERAERQRVHDVIYQELCLGKTEASSRAEYIQIIEGLAERGAEAVILGCTEIGLLLKSSHTPVRLVDTTAIHADSAVRYALNQS